MQHSTKYAKLTGFYGKLVTFLTLRHIPMRVADLNMTVWILFLSFLLVGLEPVNTTNAPNCGWPSSAAHWKTESNLRVYKHRRTEEIARNVCTSWGKYTGKSVQFTTFQARGLEDIKSHSKGTCGFGFFLRKTEKKQVGQWPFSICQVAPNPQCAEAEQRRVLPFGRRSPDCPSSSPDHNFDVLDWEQDPHSKWTIVNTGHGLEVRVPAGSVKTKVKIGTETDYLRVTKILLKWGIHNRKGSEHSFGRHKRAGEIQIFHEAHNRIGGKHVLSFLIRERNNPQNPAWRHFLHEIASHCNIIGSTHMKTSPPNIRNLLGEDASQRNQVDLSYRLRDYIRYKGPSSEASCEDHTWTVYENAFYLSRSQFTFLRSLRQFTKPYNPSLNLSPSTDNFCQHKGINR